MAANPQTKPVDLGCESAADNWQLSSTSTIAIDVGGRSSRFPSHRERRRSAVAVAPTEDGRERNNLTLVMVVIVVIFLVTQTPAYVNQLLYYLLEHSYSGKKSFDSILFDSRHRIEFFDSIRFGNLINLPLVH